MKKIIPLIFLLFALNAQSQSLKDLLFSGKMKTDSGTVVRKGEDLKDKVDTGTKKPAPAPLVQSATAASDKSKPTIVIKDSITSISVTASPASATAPAAPAAINAEPVKPAEEAAQASPQAGTAMAERAAMTPRFSQWLPGEEIPEQHWMYKFAKK